MSIRLRLTLLYSAILMLTLLIFGAALYTIQAQYTLNSLKSDLVQSSNQLVQGPMQSLVNPNSNQPQLQPPPPIPPQTLSGEQLYKDVRERQIVRVLNPDGTLVASPFNDQQTPLPLSAAGLKALQNNQVWWETATVYSDQSLIYSKPVTVDGQVKFIVQIARPLTERNRSLASLGTTLIIASLLTTLAAFGIGWVLAGIVLRPIHRITQTAQDIGNESDFSRRVDYRGPNDEIGQLAKTFNVMLLGLQEAYQRVTDALKLQHDFVADVSHELRTPLTTVRGNLALLRREPPLPAEEQSDILTDLVEESDRLIRLVNNLLVLARADAGQCLEDEIIPLRGLVEDACRLAGQLEQQREIVNSVPDLTVRGDRDALKQILMILLDNSLKYSKGTIQVTGEASGDQAVIQVSDSGPGIDPDKLEHVFDRFYRGDADPSVPGFGLGLPIAKALVEAQGGNIRIESQPDCGSTATLSLPLFVSLT